MPKRKAQQAASFGQPIVALRKAACMTKQQLAARVGVSRCMIEYYQGLSNTPTTHLPEIAQARQVSTDDLWD